MTSASSRQASASGLVRLNQAALSALPAGIQYPRYDRKALACGIMHMSVGGFHRSHQALYVDDLLNQQPMDWMICGVGLLPQDKDHIRMLNEQDGLYTILERNAERDTLRVCGSIKELLHAPSNPQAVLARLMDPAIKILSLTITEKGYCYNEEGNLDQTNPAIQNDLKNPDAPMTGLGYIVSGLARRRREKMKPFTVMSCDNLPGNGHLTQKLVLEFANLIDAGLAQWIKENVRFPSAMVDRITPVTKPEIVDLVKGQFGVDDAWPVVCEDFRQWVLEDSFCDGRPPFEKVGVQIVKDVEPYEKMKIRLLNGSHSALSYISYLMGYRQVDKAMADPLIAAFVRAYMDHDITPSVPDVPGMDLTAYKDILIKRFANPAIADQVQRLAEDGSQKIPNAILPCIEHQLKTGGSLKYASLALAGWFRYLTGVDEQMNAIEIKDPLKGELQSRVQVNPKDPTAVLGLARVFGHNLPTSGVFLTELTRAMASLHEKGVRQTVVDYLPH